MKMKPREKRGVVLLGMTALFLLSVTTFTFELPSSNLLGLFGHGIAWLLTYLFGITVYPLLAFLGWFGWKLLRTEAKTLIPKTLYFALCLFAVSTLLNVIADHCHSMPRFISEHIISERSVATAPLFHVHVRYLLGGAPSYFSLFLLQELFGNFGVILIMLALGCVSFFFLFDLSLRSFMQKKETPPALDEDVIENEIRPLPRVVRKLMLKEREEVVDQPLAPILPQRKGNYELPSLDLLNAAKGGTPPQMKRELQRQAEVLEETLLSFGIEAKVGQIHCGPTITSFEVHPAVGVKVQRITALENDIALKLQAKSIRILAPIPGKAAIGVEIPSLHPQEVSFKELMENYQGNPKRCAIPLLLGKTITGEHIVSDLAKMPHCLIAGATGSGKSVCINTLIFSIVMNAAPDEVRLLLIDPKKVELPIYTTLPHMVAPVITEPHGAASALLWLVREMERRYDLLKQEGLRHLAAYNSRMKQKEGETLPYIVAIIDEYADLILASTSDIETPIVRLAQMARAIGIHMILATQRPSREVITGLIKANFPTRIAFKVASRINSQIILDETGAESLLGAGDMLFLPPGGSVALRAQGAFLSDEEIHRVIQTINARTPTTYLVASFDRVEGDEMMEEVGRDTLYGQALQTVLESGIASTTFLQRKLKIGYARAASLMDELETKGVIGPQEGSRPRRVLMGRRPEGGLPE